MSSAILASVGSIVLALLAGLVVPTRAMTMLWPSLCDTGPATRNYRGAPVRTGLGLAWLLWAAAMIVAAAVATAMSGLASGDGAQIAMAAWGTWQTAAFLVVAAFAFGLADDVFGDQATRGFRGHVRQMLRGRLSTGGLKLLGIGTASAIAALYARPGPVVGGEPPVVRAVEWVLSALVIALAANVVNLTDLRPGRALKAYLMLAAVGFVASAAAGIASSAHLSVRALTVGTAASVSAIVLLGPVLAVWRYDLGEKGMLGDAGANSMGALAGYLLASSLPMWGLAIAAAGLAALNLASERISFSRVIEKNGLLRWLDGLGRMHDGPDDEAGSAARAGDGPV